MKPESRHYSPVTFVLVSVECIPLLKASGFDEVESTIEQDGIESIAVWFHDKTYMQVDSKLAGYKYIPTEHLEALAILTDDTVRHDYMRMFSLDVYSEVFEKMLTDSKVTIQP